MLLILLLYCFFILKKYYKKHCIVRNLIKRMSLKDFQFLGKLGEGAYSSVYKVKRLIDNEIYAIKKVKLNNLT